MLMAEPEQASGPQTIVLSALEGIPVESPWSFILQIIPSIRTYSVQGARVQVAMNKAALPRNLGEGKKYRQIFLYEKPSTLSSIRALKMSSKYKLEKRSLFHLFEARAFVLQRL